MADQDDVRRIALALPDTSEADDRFALSVSNKGKQKGLASFRTRHSLSYSSCRRIQTCQASPSSRPFGAWSRIG